MSLANLTFRITADVAGFKAGLDQVKAQLRGVGDQVRGSFQGASQQINSSAASAGTSVGGLVGKLGGLAVAYAALKSIQSFARISDEAALATARIQGLTGSIQQTHEAQAALFEMAQRLQAPYGEVQASFARMLPAVQALGGGVAETTRLTEILTTTAKLSGASAAEAGASALQFAQALGSGALQGDELRSILENNNTLARTLAEGLGVSIGELRKMGEEGKLTADLVAGTLLGSYDAIQAKATEMPSTVGGAWTQIRNAFGLLVTAISEGTGVFGAIAAVMGEVAKVLGVVARAMFSGGEEADRLANRKGAIEFAQSAGRAFAWLADVVTAVVRTVIDVVGALIAVFRAAGNQLGAIGAAIGATLRGDFAGAAAIMRDAGEVGAAAVTRLGTAIGESAARMKLAWTGAGEAYRGYVAQIEAGTPETGGGGPVAKLASTGGGGGGEQDDKATNKAAAKSMDADMEAIQAAIDAERKRFAVAQEVANIRTAMDRDRALAAIEMEQQVAKHQLDTQQLTNEQYLAQELAFEDRKYEIRRASAERALEIARAEGKDPVAVEEINAQLLQLEQDYQLRKQQITLDVQAAAAGAGGGGGAGADVWRTTQNSMASALDAMLTRSKSFGQAMAGVWGSIRAAIVGEIAKILMAKIAAFAKERLLALAGITASAAKAGAGAAESQASIPYVGPILAIAAMAAIMAAVMGLGGSIKSARGGFDIPAGVNPITQLHAEEMVLPAEHAKTIRQLSRLDTLTTVNDTLREFTRLESFAPLAAARAAPVFVPVAVPVAAAPASAGAMTLPSAAGGFDIPAGVNPITQLHAREMVLPAQHAETIRSLSQIGSMTSKVSQLASLTAIIKPAVAQLSVPRAAALPSAAAGYDIPAGLNPVTQLHAQEMVLPAEHANTIRELSQSPAPAGPPIELHGVSAGEFFIAVRKDLVAALKGAHREFAF